jgi:hypothetical protein
LWKQVALGIALLATAQLLSATPAALAQDPPRVPVEQTTTEQKAQFVGNLVTRSVAAQTIETKGDQEAKAKLARARALVEEAKADLAGGAYESANGKLNEAFRLLTVEARKLSEEDVKRERLQEAYDRNRNAVTIFLTAYERVAREKELSAVAGDHVAEIRKSIAEAEALAADDKIGEANAVLESAYRLARGDIREMREGETLTRSLNFETPEDEYHYEKGRNDSHILLLQYAIAEKNPPQTRLERIDELRREAMTLRDQAEGKARSGDPAGALGMIARSTESLLKAIRMSGMWIPG